MLVLQRSLEEHEAQESTEPKPVKARTTRRAISPIKGCDVAKGRSGCGNSGSPFLFGRGAVKGVALKHVAVHRGFC
jgi:hypothetical protein